MTHKHEMLANRMNEFQKVVDYLATTVLHCQTSFDTLSMQFGHSDGQARLESQPNIHLGVQELQKQADTISDMVFRRGASCVSIVEQCAATQTIDNSEARLEKYNKQVATSQVVHPAVGTGFQENWIRRPSCCSPVCESVCLVQAQLDVQATDTEQSNPDGMDTAVSGLHTKLAEIASYMHSIEQAQPAGKVEIDDLRAGLADTSLKMQACVEERSEAREAIDELKHILVLQKIQISGIQESVEVLQSSSQAHICNNACDSRVTEATEKLVLVNQDVSNMMGDMNNQQERAENYQRANDARVEDLSDAVQNTAAEVSTLRRLLDDCHGNSNGTDAVTFSRKQATQIRHTMKLVDGADEKLSALNEIIVNNKSETAELRQLLRALQSTQRQLADDLLHVRISLEERLDAMEEVSSHIKGDGQQDHVANRIDILGTRVDALRSDMQSIQLRIESTESIQAPQETTTECPSNSDGEEVESCHTELKRRIDLLEESMADIRRTQQLAIEQFEQHSAHEDALGSQGDISNALAEVQINTYRLQHETENVRELMQQHCDMPDMMSQVTGTVKVMDAKINELVKMKEQAVDKSTLDSLLAEVEAAMDDIANELDDIKVANQTPIANILPRVDLLQDKLNQHDQQVKTIMREFEVWRDDAAHGSVKDMRSQLEALGQRFRILADDVEEIEAVLRVKALPTASTDLIPLSHRVEQLQKDLAASRASHGSIIQGIVVHGSLTECI